MSAPQPLGPLGLAAIAAAGVGGYYLYKRSQDELKKPPNRTLTQTRDQTQPPPVPPAPVIEDATWGEQAVLLAAEMQQRNAAAAEAGAALAEEIARERELTQVANEAGLASGELEAALRNRTTQQKIDELIAGGMAPALAYAISGVVAPPGV